MKLLYLILSKDHFNLNYEDECEIMKIVKALNMSLSDEYGAYTNSKTICQFLVAIFSHISNIMLLNVFNSLVFSLMINASIGHTMKHLMIFVCFVSQDKKGSIVIMFVELLKVETMYTTNMGLF